METLQRYVRIVDVRRSRWVGKCELKAPVPGSMTGYLQSHFEVHDQVDASSSVSEFVTLAHVGVTSPKSLSLWML